jgi:hypothetical protein
MILVRGWVRQVVLCSGARLGTSDGLEGSPGLMTIFSNFLVLFLVSFRPVLGIGCYCSCDG